MTRKRAVITGIGAITPYGAGVDKLWEALKAGKSAISTIERISLDGQNVHIAGEIKNFEQMGLIDPKEAKRLDRFNQFALVAADEANKPAIKAAGLLTRDSRMKERKKPGLKKARKAPQFSKR